MEYNYTVYILHCSDGSFYTGITNDVMHRVDEHQMGVHKKSYTFKRRPVELAYTAAFSDVHEAIHWEKIVKGWRREKKEALIKGEHERVIQLSRTAINWMVYPYIKNTRSRAIWNLKFNRDACRPSQAQDDTLI